MLKNLLFMAVATILAGGAQAQNPRVWLDTELGHIIVELDEVNAPITTENFLRYVDEGFYDGTVFHRVVKDFVVQGGGHDHNLDLRTPTHGAISNEGNNGLLNVPGSIAMARTSDPDSARSQFFFNTSHNSHLDGGYAVFGEVVAGMNTIAALNNLRVHSQSDLPVRPPMVRRAVQTDGFPIMPLHTGSWFDPANAGVGFNIEVTNDASSEQGPLMVVYWYDYSQGEAIWLTGVAGFDYGASVLSMELIMVPGPNADADFLSPPPREAFATWGTLTIAFDDCRTGRFVYDSPTFGQGEVTATRLTIPDGASCEGL